MDMELTADDEQALTSFALGCTAMGMSPGQIVSAFRLTKPITFQFVARLDGIRREQIQRIGDHIGTTGDPWTAGLLAGLALAERIIDEGPPAADAVAADGFITRLREENLAFIHAMDTEDGS